MFPPNYPLLLIVFSLSLSKVAWSFLLEWKLNFDIPAQRPLDALKFSHKMPACREMEGWADRPWQVPTARCISRVGTAPYVWLHVTCKITFRWLHLILLYSEFYYTVETFRVLFFSGKKKIVSLLSMKVPFIVCKCFKFLIVFSIKSINCTEKSNEYLKH